MSDNIIDEFQSQEKLPEYYSPTVIVVFCALFSPIFGSVLMAMNLKGAALKWQCVGAAILYTVTYATIGGMLGLPRYASLAASIGGGYILKSLYWDRYIGDQRAYIRRSWIYPALIGIGIVVSLFGLALLLLAGGDLAKVFDVQ